MRSLWQLAGAMIIMTTASYHLLQVAATKPGKNVEHMLDQAILMTLNVHVNEEAQEFAKLKKQLDRKMHFGSSKGASADGKPSSGQDHRLGDTGGGRKKHRHQMMGPGSPGFNSMMMHPVQDTTGNGMKRKGHHRGRLSGSNSNGKQDGSTGSNDGNSALNDAMNSAHGAMMSQTMKHKGHPRGRLSGSKSNDNNSALNGAMMHPPYLPMLHDDDSGQQKGSTDSSGLSESADGVHLGDDETYKNPDSKKGNEPVDGAHHGDDDQSHSAEPGPSEPSDHHLGDDETYKNPDSKKGNEPVDGAHHGDDDQSHSAEPGSSEPLDDHLDDDGPSKCKSGRCGRPSGGRPSASGENNSGQGADSQSQAQPKLDDNESQAPSAEEQKALEKMVKNLEASLPPELVNLLETKSVKFYGLGALRADLMDPSGAEKAAAAVQAAMGKTDNVEENVAKQEKSSSGIFKWVAIVGCLIVVVVGITLWAKMRNTEKPGEEEAAPAASGSSKSRAASKTASHLNAEPSKSSNRSSRSA